MSAGTAGAHRTHRWQHRGDHFRNDGAAPHRKWGCKTRGSCGPLSHTPIAARKIFTTGTLTWRRIARKR